MISPLFYFKPKNQATKVAWDIPQRKAAESTKLAQTGALPEQG
jgi:hypothetical protein